MTEQDKTEEEAIQIVFKDPIAVEHAKDLVRVLQSKITYTASGEALPFRYNKAVAEALLHDT